MVLTDILERIDERLKVMGLTDNAASKLAGKSQAIRNMRRAVQAGRGGVNMKTLTALAPVLEVTPAWLLEGENSGHGDPYDAVLDDLRATRDEIDMTIKRIELQRQSKKIGKNT